MGMFDYLRVDLELPDLELDRDIVYQTKSFDRLMDLYVITPGRELYRESWERRLVEDPDHIFGFFIETIPGTRREEYLTDFHGDVIFYSLDTDVPEENKWRNYIARFSNGKCTKIWHKDINILNKRLT